MASPHQSKHILCAAAEAALARELAAGVPTAGDAELAQALAIAGPELRAVLRRYPPRALGNGRMNALLFALDVGLRTES
ncbi:MAG: hypothetical protein QM811_28690 [Pirellulales bacterium]